MRHEIVQAADRRFTVHQADEPPCAAVVVIGRSFEDAAVAYLEAASCAEVVSLVVCEEDTGLELCFSLDLRTADPDA